MTDKEIEGDPSIRFLPFEVFGPEGEYWLAARNGDPRLAAFLPASNVADVPFPEERSQYWRGRPDQRRMLVEALLQSDLPRSPCQLEAIHRLSEADSLVVVTGQQPGAFGGPLYTFLKFASTIVYAQQLESRWGVPVVPVLWDGGDDHDLAEVDSLTWPTLEGDQVQFSFGLSDLGERSAWSIPFPHARFEEVMIKLSSIHPATDYFNQAMTFIRSQAQEGLSWCDVFDRFWLSLFESFPLVIVRPWEPALRELAGRILESEVTDPTVFSLAIEEVSAALEAAGFKPRIHKTRESCSFFRSIEGHRISVRFSGGEFQVGEAASQVSSEEMLKSARTDPAAFSPSALLRPIVQDAILPTAATVLGPSEMAYHAQLGPLYARHGVPRPTILPRLSATLVSQNQAEKMEQLDIHWVDLLRDEEDLAKEVVQSPLLSGAMTRIDALRASLDDTARELSSLLKAERPGQSEPVESQLGRMGKTLDQIEDYLRREENKRDQTTLRQIHSLLGFLRPGGEMQERIYGLAPFLCRFGFDWIAGFLRDAEDWDGKSHVVYSIGAKKK